MDDRWTQIRTLFREALEMEPAQWEPFLESHCPDAQMREKVLSMLAAYDEDDTFLEHPAADIGPSAQQRNTTQGNTTTQLVGTRVGPYEIKRSIARGGMGVVFEALDTKLDKIVALKMMSPALVQDPSFRQRFEQEARTLARLEDPHFVRVNALIDEGPNTFIVMEYVDGVTLAQHIRKRGTLSAKDAITVGLQLLQALSKAHRQGIVHRDLKPSNIMLTKNYEGRLLVKVLDFGIAKNILPDGSQTRTVGAVGTLFYMSPEQARGLRTIDHRTDLYSLAVTLYEAVSGTLPFDTSVDEYTVRRQIVEGQVIPIIKRLPGLETALANILSKALSTKPEERYADAEEMRQALLAAMNEIRLASKTPIADGRPPVQKTPAVQPAMQQSSASNTPQKKPFTALLGIGLIAVFLAAAFFIYNKFSTPQPDPAAIALVEDARDLTTNGQADVLSTADSSGGGLETDPILLAGDESLDPDVNESNTPVKQPTPANNQPEIITPPDQDSNSSTLLASADPVTSDPASNVNTANGDVDPSEILEDSVIQQPKQPVLTGVLSIRSLQFGRTYVNDVLQQDPLINIDTLAIGEHTVRIDNVEFGRWVCRWNVTVNPDQYVNVDFETSIAATIIAEDIATGAGIEESIYLDGEQTNYATPQKVVLNAGLRQIEIRSSDYEQVETVLDNKAGCFQQAGGNTINVHPAHVQGSAPRIILRMKKID